MGRVLNPIVSESYMKKYMEEHGGGGGNNFCTITIDNSAGAEVLFQEVLIGENFVENGLLIQGSPFELMPTDVTVVQAIPTKFDMSENEILAVVAGVTPYAIVSDMVNCSIAFEDDPYRYIAPTDSTKPSSLKITVSTDEGGGGGDDGGNGGIS